MGNVRPELKKSQWRLDKHEFYTAYHFALNYLPWVMARNELLGLKSLDDMAGVVGSLPGDPVGSAAVQVATLSNHIEMIETAAKEAGEDLAKWILLGVTNERLGYNTLRMRYGIPCGKNEYYERRRKFYWLLSRQLFK